MAIKLLYSPRPHQQLIHNAGKHRFRVVVCHRRFGKTICFLNELIDGALRSKLHQPRFHYIAPYLKQAKVIAWDQIKYYTSPLVTAGLAVINESELRVDFANEARIRLLGSDNADAMRGGYSDGVILDEFGDQTPRAWAEVVRPMLVDRQGWAMIGGTPRGRNHFYDLYKMASSGGDDEWHASIYPASITGVIPAQELESARKTMSQEEYDQEYECSFNAPNSGAIYGSEMAAMRAQGRITRVPYIADCPVYTAWDLGYADNTTIWFFQIVGCEIHLIDYYENNGEGLGHYANLLNSKGYTYKTHIWPHDGKKGELGTGLTLIENARNLGIWPIQGLPIMSIAEGIQRARNLMPRIYIDEVKCRDGIACLEGYRSEWSDRNRTYRPTPVHDWASHGADAFRYLAVGLGMLEAVSMGQIGFQAQQPDLRLYDALTSLGG